MSARETTVNIRASEAEKELWRPIAPDGKIGPWLRALANREVQKAKRKR